MQITRLLAKGLSDHDQQGLQQEKSAILNRIGRYTASLQQALQNGYSNADVAAHVMLEVEEVMQKSVQWNLIKCCKGCGFCCNVNVEMTEAEAEVIIKYCREKNIPINTEILLEQLNLTSNERPFHKHSRCVFLDDNDACKIYEARPVNCRKHLSQTDPDFCNNAKHAEGNVGINFEINTEILVSAFGNLGMKQGTMAEMILAKLPADTTTIL